MNPAIRQQTIADLVHRRAKPYPHKTGLLCSDRSWTFAEFDALVFTGALPRDPCGKTFKRDLRQRYQSERGDVVICKTRPSHATHPSIQQARPR